MKTTLFLAFVAVVAGLGLLASDKAGQTPNLTLFGQLEDHFGPSSDPTEEIDLTDVNGKPVPAGASGYGKGYGYPKPSHNGYVDSEWVYRDALRNW